MGSAAGFLKLDPIAGRVVEEGLAPGADLDRIGDRDPHPAKFGDGRVEIGHRQREVLAQRRRRSGLDEVDLLPPASSQAPPKLKSGRSVRSVRPSTRV